MRNRQRRRRTFTHSAGDGERTRFDRAALFARHALFGHGATGARIQSHGAGSVCEHRAWIGTGREAISRAI